jgi:hypothetical protein
MKRLILKGNQIATLLKVSSSCWGFYDLVEKFLENNKDTPDCESVELELKEYIFSDFIEMIKGYLRDDSLSDQDIPSEREKIELQYVLEDLKIING